MKKKVIKIPVETQIDINDNSVVWYPIIGYPGYECTIINGNMMIRSLKSPHAYPYGALLKINTDHFTYTLTNSNNQRIKITFLKISELLDKSSPRSTASPDIYKARNNRAFINPDAESKDGKIIDKPRDIRIDDQKLFFPKFNIPDNIEK